MNFKKFSKWVSVALVLTLLISLFVPLGGQAQAATVKLNKSKVTIRVGSTIKLTVQGTTKKVKWNSDDDTIAKVNENGKVYGKKEGKTLITASVNNKEYRCTVTIKEGKIGKPYNYFSYETNSVDGVKVYWQADNNTGKTINYYTVNFKFTNPVGDPAYDELSGKNTYSAKYVGPVAKDEFLLVYSEIGYIPALGKLSITSIDIVYSDKTTETIEYNYSTKRDSLSFGDFY